MRIKYNIVAGIALEVRKILYYNKPGNFQNKNVYQSQQQFKVSKAIIPAY